MRAAPWGCGCSEGLLACGEGERKGQEVVLKAHRADAQCPCVLTESTAMRKMHAQRACRSAC